MSREGNVQIVNIDTEVQKLNCAVRATRQGHAPPNCGKPIGYNVTTDALVRS